MIFFMTRKTLDTYINSCVENTICQYGMDEIESKVSEINDKLESVNAELDKKILQLLYNESEIKGIVENVLKEAMQPMSSLSEDKLNKEQIVSKLCNYIDQVVDKYDDGIVREINNSSTNVIKQLEILFQQEKEKNIEYANIIKNKELKIAELGKTVESMKADINSLSESVNKLMSKSLDTVPVSEIPTEEVILPKQYLVFTDDSSENLNLLQEIIEQTKCLRNKIMSTFEKNEDAHIYLKLVDKCVMKMEQLICKNQNGEIEPEKIANDCAKVFKQTISKVMTQEKLRGIIEDYMEGCNIRKLNWKIGKKLTGDDLEYLEEPIFYEEVDDKELDCTIREIKQDTFIIDYIDNNEKYEVVIPGIYCLGKYKK